MTEDPLLFDLPALSEKPVAKRRRRPGPPAPIKRRLHRKSTAEPALFRLPAQGATRGERLDLYERVLFLRKQNVAVYRSGKRQHHVGNRLLSTRELYALADHRGFK